MSDDLSPLINAAINTARTIAAVLEERRFDAAVRMKRSGHDDDEVIAFLETQWEADRLWMNKQLARLVPQLNDMHARGALRVPEPWPPMLSRTIQ